ncbi:MAG: Asp23/Gls24 family envelope stress response protein [Lachnospiraceae bacterium]
MEEKNTYVLQDNENIGAVQIADDVVVMIAGLAAREVEGVSAMVGNVTGELMSKVGVKNLAKGVKVDILGKDVRVDLSVNVEYGYNIPAVSQKIQTKVKTAIENMTGLNVTDVNIRIAGVNMQKSK